jgi:hypothetical protein
MRSLILETFPLELRVKLDMLARQRNLVNDAQQARLFEYLHEYGVDGIQLGMGTNRYGFKVNSYVVKFATNDEGRIDNLKEFKMAKRLQPYVTMVHEVAENGLLLVAEYIQPFESYGEMLKYEDKIKDILRELSSTYLIGDVGISDVNYGNWGLRIGTEDPVCLDFAYVYNVSSDIFLCNEAKCRGKVMLVPNAKFSHMQCPRCNKIYLFEELRIKIGEKQHLDEIGDLSKEGYVLSESKVEMMLDPSKSHYLNRKKKKVKKTEVVEEVVPPDTFIMDYPATDHRVK